MAKFRLSTVSVLSVNSQTITCVGEFSLDESVDVYVSECESSAYNKPQILGGKAINGSITIELEHTGSAMLGYLAPRVTGALLCQPNGTGVGDLKFSATVMTITGRSLSTSRTGLVTVTCPFFLNDLLIEGNPA